MPGRELMRFGLVAVCGVALFLSACSDKQEQTQTPPATKGVSEQQAGQSAESRTPAAATAPAPAGGGGKCAAVLTTMCTECHAITRICEKIGKKSKSRWQRTLDRMIDRGAKLSAADAVILIDCLDNGATNDLRDACR